MFTWCVTFKEFSWTNERLIFQGAVITCFRVLGGGMGESVFHKKLETLENRKKLKVFYSNILTKTIMSKCHMIQINLKS